MKTPVEREDLFAVKIDDGAERIVCRTLPFLAAHPGKRGRSRRTMDGPKETIPVGATAETLYLLGMINEGWDYGVAHWGEHPELRTTRDDQVYIGSRIGELEIKYAGGTSDRIPVVIGATAWFVAQWGFGPTHGVPSPVKEPFASRPDYAAALARALRLGESDEAAGGENAHAHYFLGVKARPEKIESIIIHDNPALRGRPLVSAMTLAGAGPGQGLMPFGKWRADASDLKPAIDSAHPGDWSKDLAALSDLLYTRESDLPKKVDLIPFPDGFNAARLRFTGGVEGDMLSSIWVANLSQIAEKFERDTGFFHETGKDCPWYGGYSGIEVRDFPVLIPESDGLVRAKVGFTYEKKTATFKLQSDRPLPNLAVRLGPFDETAARRFAEGVERPPASTVRVESSGKYNRQSGWWVWIDKMGSMTHLDIVGR